MAKKVASYSVDVNVYQRDAEAAGIDPSTDVPANFTAPTNAIVEEIIENAIHERFPAFEAHATSERTDK